MPTAFRPELPGPAPRPQQLRRHLRAACGLWYAGPVPAGFRRMLVRRQRPCRTCPPYRVATCCISPICAPDRRG